MTRNLRVLFSATVWTALFVSTACGSSDAKARRGVRSDTAVSATIATNSSAGAGSDVGSSVAVRTTNGDMVLGMAHDTVYMGLSDSVVELTRADMARDTSGEAGFAGTISRFVKKKVGTALGARVVYPLADIESVSYVNGSIVFAYRTRRTMTFDEISADHKKALASFSPPDARLFVSVVDSALKAERGTAR